jgi:hypothetical protein
MSRWTEPNRQVDQRTRVVPDRDPHQIRIVFTPQIIAHGNGASPPKDWTAMALIFPNRSRSFDETRQGVRFLGYDGMFEVRFLVEAEALRSATEAACLNAFDATRPSIQEAASKAYARRRGNNFTLTAQDFR